MEDKSREIPIYNLWRDEHYITLKPDEEICPRCKGTGTSHRTQYGFVICSLCYSTGKVDWIKRIRGV